MEISSIGRDFGESVREAKIKGIDFSVKTEKPETNALWNSRCLEL